MHGNSESVSDRVAATIRGRGARGEEWGGDKDERKGKGGFVEVGRSKENEEGDGRTKLVGRHPLKGGSD